METRRERTQDDDDAGGGDRPGPRAAAHAGLSGDHHRVVHRVAREATVGVLVEVAREALATNRREGTLYLIGMR